MCITNSALSEHFFRVNEDSLTETIKNLSLLVDNHFFDLLHSLKLSKQNPDSRWAYISSPRAPALRSYIHPFGKLHKCSLKINFILSVSAPPTQKSLVKGERFICYVWRAWVATGVLCENSWSDLNPKKVFNLTYLFDISLIAKSFLMLNPTANNYPASNFIASRPFG